MAIDKITTASITDANITTAKLAYQAIPFRNIIINGDMSLAQRATSVSGVGNGDSGYHTCDRWKFFELGAGTGEFTQSQSTDVPTGQGFATSLKMDCTTADASLAAADVMWIQQIVEAQNLQYIKKGTSSAESLTLSFWVYATKTGTNICELYDENNRQVSKSYTISSSNTWEKKTITFPADTSGALGNDNGIGMYVNFFLLAGSNYTSGTLSETWTSSTNANRAVGQVNHSDNTSNNFYITGVQLEAGTSASDFEFLPVDVNFERCKRYFTIPLRSRGSDTVIANGTMYNATDFYGIFEVGKGMRTSPSFSFATGTNFYGIVGNAASDLFTGSSTMTFQNVTNDGTCKVRIEVTSVSGKSQGQAAWVRFEAASSSSDFISADAEL